MLFFFFFINKTVRELVIPASQQPLQLQGGHLDLLAERSTLSTTIVCIGYTVLLEYFAGEKHLRMSQIGIKI